MCCFEFETNDEKEDDRSEAFVGDTILPVYTPNVGGADVRVEQPLKRYLNTLEIIVEREFDRVWPGHRDVIGAPSKRAQAITDHHRERARRVIRILEKCGPSNAWEVSAQLFGDLKGIHIMHGPGEAYAHLDHLSRHDLVERTSDGYYVLKEAEIAISDVI